MFQRPVGSLGRFNCQRKAQHFWRWYYKKRLKYPVPYSKGRDLFKEILHELAKMSIETGEHFYIKNLGYFCAVKIKNKVVKDGKVKMSKMGIDWKATKENWKILYPEVTTSEELKSIKDRPFIYHQNKSKLGYTVKIHWLRVLKAKNIKFRAISSIETMLGKKQNSGAIGLSEKQDFEILKKNLTRRK